MADMPVPMPIVVGAPRSGTTLLRMMLDAHGGRRHRNGDALRCAAAVGVHVIRPLSGPC